MSHGVAAAALGTAFPRQAVSLRVMVLGLACSMAPDIDVLGYLLGFHHGDLLNHRGITHSLLFAAVFASLAFLATSSGASRSPLIWTYLFLAGASHGLLDALTDRTGLGIPFLWPFDSTRYFFPFTPIGMSPLAHHFFSQRGVSVLLSEMLWVWVPSLLFSAIALSVKRIVANRSISK